MYDLKGGKDRISTMAGVDLGIVIAMQLGIMPLFPNVAPCSKAKFMLMKARMFKILFPDLWLDFEQLRHVGG